MTLLKGYCNGGKSKGDCGAVSLNSSNIQTLSLPVTQNGFIMLGYKTHPAKLNKDIILYDNTLVVFDFDGYIDFDCDYIQTLKNQTMCVKTGSGGLHVYYWVEGQHDFSKEMARPMHEKLKEKMGKSDCKIDLLTKEKVFAPGTFFSVPTKGKPAHKNPYVILGTADIAILSFDEINNLFDKSIGPLAEMTSIGPQPPLIETNKTKLGDIFKMRPAFRDMITGKYQIIHQKDSKRPDLIELQYWEMLYREFVNVTGKDPFELVDYFKQNPSIQPAFLLDETTKMLPYSMKKTQWNKRPTKETYEKYFPEYRLGLKKQEILTEIENQYINRSEFSKLIDLITKLYNRMKILEEEIKILKGGKQ